jgi:hypothetical protein
MKGTKLVFSGLLVTGLALALPAAAASASVRYQPHTQQTWCHQQDSSRHDSNHGWSQDKRDRNTYDNGSCACQDTIRYTNFDRSFFNGHRRGDAIHFVQNVRVRHDSWNCQPYQPPRPKCDPNGYNPFGQQYNNDPNQHNSWQGNNDPYSQFSQGNDPNQRNNSCGCQQGYKGGKNGDPGSRNYLTSITTGPTGPPTGYNGNGNDNNHNYNRDPGCGNNSNGNHYPQPHQTI